MPDAEWDAALSRLRAYIDEDERIALAAVERDGRRWATSSDGDVLDVDAAGSGYVATGPWSGSLFETGEHFARHDPDRVLREIEAKRRLVDAALAARENLSEAFFWDTFDGGYAAGLDHAVRLAAVPFSGLPDFPEVLRLDQAETHPYVRRREL